MSEEQIKMLVCARWDAPGVLKHRIKTNCQFCGCEIGYDAMNAARVEAENYGFACGDCFIQKFVKDKEPGEYRGSLVGGRMFENLTDAVEAAHKRQAEESDHDA